jgi:fluoroquinolone transport system permease protein
VPERIRPVFGIFPTHWIFQSIESVTKGSSIIFTSVIGFLFIGGLLLLVSKLFIRKHFV